MKDYSSSPSASLPLPSINRNQPLSNTRLRDHNKLQKVHYTLPSSVKAKWRNTIINCNTNYKHFLKQSLDVHSLPVSHPLIIIRMNSKYPNGELTCEDLAEYSMFSTSPSFYTNIHSYVWGILIARGIYIYIIRVFYKMSPPTQVGPPASTSWEQELMPSHLSF